jgi:protein SCO1/2
MTNTQRPTKASFVPARFDLIDHDGNHVTNERYAGNYVLVFFGFTHCKMVCPRALTKLSDVLDSLGGRAEHITALYITVDPDRDTAGVMKAFLIQYYPRFTGLTGSLEAVESAKKQFRVFAKRTPTPMTLKNMLFRIRRSPTFSGRTESSSRTSPIPPKRPI